MRTYSSTNLKLMDNHCGQALTFAEQDAPMDRELFQTGIAAHAVLQEVALKRPTSEEELNAVATATVTELLTNGRSYNGRHEPPMAPHQAFAGRDLAVNWVVTHEMPEGEMRVERGYGITAEGMACDYDAPECRYRGILDLVYGDIEGDEEYQYPVIVIRDWKSAWTADASELETLQRKGQAVIAWRHLPAESDIMAIRLEISNLRTGITHDRTIMLDPEGETLMEQWEKDILLTCDVADKPREARPGANCVGCPYTLECDSNFVASYNLDNLAVAFACAQAQRDKLFELVKKEADEGDLTVPGGHVGFYAQPRQKLLADGHHTLAKYWADATGEEGDISASALSLLHALKLGSTQIKNAATVIYPGRGTKDDRQSLMNNCLESFAIPVFKVWRD